MPHPKELEKLSTAHQSLRLQREHLKRGAWRYLEKVFNTWHQAWHFLEPDYLTNRWFESQICLLLYRKSYLLFQRNHQRSTITCFLFTENYENAIHPTTLYKTLWGPSQEDKTSENKNERTTRWTTRLSLKQQLLVLQKLGNPPPNSTLLQLSNTLKSRKAFPFFLHSLAGTLLFINNLNQKELKPVRIRGVPVFWPILDRHR